MNSEYSNLSSFNSRKAPLSPKKKAFIYVVLFVVIIGAAIFAGNHFLSGKPAKPSSEVVIKSETPTPTQMPTPTEAASVSATPTPARKVTPTSTAKVSPSPTTSSSKLLQIEVLNGSGTRGEAGRVATLLKNAGYTITSTGNADTFDYSSTVIKIKKSKAQFAAQLKADLSASYTVDPATQTLAENSSSDAIVIVGAK